MDDKNKVKLEEDTIEEDIIKDDDWDKRWEETFSSYIEKPISLNMFHEYMKKVKEFK